MSMHSGLQDFVDEVRILKSLFENTYEQAGGRGHRFFHSLRVAGICLELQQKLLGKSRNEKFLVLAALFHDIGKAPRVEAGGRLDGRLKADMFYGRHNIIQVVYPLLYHHLSSKYPPKKLALVSAYISGNGSLESQLLQDADNLDEMGLVNIWKMFTYSGLNKVSIIDTVDYYFKEDRPRLIEKIRSEMYFPETKTMGLKRLERVDQFLNDLIDEAEARIL